MSNISIFNMPTARAADLRRRKILNRIKAPEHTADLITSLAFPPNPDRDDRQPTAAHFMAEVRS